MMTERIKLTEEDIVIEEHMNGYYLRFFGNQWNKKEYGGLENITRLMNQLLENK